MAKYQNSTLVTSLNKMKEEAAKKAEEEEKAKKQKMAPPGTRLLCEEERVETLNNLKKSKVEITSTLQHMPISLKTLAIKQRKEELEKQLSEIEKAIDTFSKKEVYIATQ